MSILFKKVGSGPAWRHSWRAKMAHYPEREERRVRDAFQLILRRVEACNANILPNTGRDGTERFVAPVLELARLWTWWQRAPCSWEPQSGVPQEQFRELARHLLVSYPVPAFLYSVFDEVGERRYTEWFAHVGAGRNIRTAPGMTAVLTSRMAHHMMEALEQYGVLAAVRWGQIRGLDGKASLIRDVVGTRLGLSLGSVEEEAFRFTFLQWLVNHPEVPGSEIGPLVDFLAARRERDPDFSLKGRSPQALLRLMHAWHEELRRAPGLGFRALPRSGIAAVWSCVDDQGDFWTVEELADTFVLHAEGQAMQHCVFSYANAVLQGQCSIWSVKVEKAGRPERTLTLEVRNSMKKVVQARGRRNRMPTGAERRILTCWASENGLQLGI